MAKMNDLFGSGHGRLGNLVFYRMNGLNIVRTRPAHFSDRKSPAQLAQRQRMQVVNNFMRPFLPLLHITFPPQKEGRTARSEAQSYLMRNALAGEYPGIHIDNSKVLLSRGPLPLPAGATVTAGTEELLIEWENGEEAAGSRAHDTLVAIALSAETGQAVYRFTGTHRISGQYLWQTDLPAGQVDLWLAFRDEGQTEMSDSRYLGRAEIKVES